MALFNKLTLLFYDISSLKSTADRTRTTPVSEYSTKVPTTVGVTKKRDMIETTKEEENSTEAPADMGATEEEVNAGVVYEGEKEEMRSSEMSHSDPGSPSLKLGLNMVFNTTPEGLMPRQMQSGPEGDAKKPNEGTVPRRAGVRGSWSERI